MRKRSDGHPPLPHMTTVNETAKLPCYDKEFWGTDSCTNMACPYHSEDSSGKCRAAAGCPGYEAHEDFCHS